MAQQLINSSNPLNNNTGTVRLGGNIANTNLNNLDQGSNPAKIENLPYSFNNVTAIGSVDDIQKGIDIASSNRTDGRTGTKFPRALTIMTLENKTTGADTVEQLRDGRYWSSTTKTFVLRTAINTATVTTSAEAAPISTLLNGKAIINGV